MKRSDNEAFIASPLNVFVVWQPQVSADRDDSLGQSLADQIYCAFCRDDEKPLTRGLGIPVYFRSVASGADAPPREIDLNSAEHCAIVVLIDDEMIAESARWDDYLAQLGQSCRESEGRHRMIPVGLTPNAVKYLPGMAATNLIRYYEIKERLTDADENASPLLTTRERDLRGKEAEFSTWLLYAVSRFLQANPDDAPEDSENERVFLLENEQVRLFISHAKQGGLEHAQELKQQIEELPTKAFFDRVDIEPATEFDKALEDGVRTSIFVALHTDAYATREWCRREVFFAKQFQRPFVAVNAVESGEYRGFPYLGNVPVLRWTGRNAMQIVKFALLENLRFEFARRRLQRLQRMGLLPSDAIRLLRPPELLDFIALKNAPKDAPFVYPDPPLGGEELDVLHEFWPENTFVTPITRGGRPDLSSRAIALSLSQSAGFAELGFGTRHEKDLLVEVGRHLLACGAQLVYGGHLKEDGWTRVLFDLVGSYSRIDPNVKKILDFVAWDWSLGANAGTVATFFDVGQIKKVPPPADVVARYELDVSRPLRESALSEADKAYIRARSLTAMRETMNESLQARIVMGGKMRGYSGKYPGIVEEVAGCLRRGKPVYLVGGFGGAAAALTQLAQGDTPVELADEYQSQNASYRDMAELYNARHAADTSPELAPIDYARLTDELRKQLVAALLTEDVETGLAKNGLTIAENQRLFTSVDVDEVVYLVLKGIGCSLQ